MSNSTTSAPRGPERFVQPSADGPEGSPLRAFLAGLALLGLVVGVPVLLVVLSGPPPIPTELPDRQFLTEQLGVETLLSILLAVVWLAWLQFAVSVVLEFISLVRGGGLPTALPFGGPSQAAARALVGTLLVGTSFFASSGIATAVTPDQVAPAQEQSAQVEDRQDRGADTQVRGGDRQDQDRPERATGVAGVPGDMTDAIGHKVAIVNPPDGHYHDNLWDIAERHLGDGRRWNEIFELNKDRQQPDGQQLVLGRLIQPGWVLVMPNDATGLERVSAVGGEEAGAKPDRGTPAEPTSQVGGVEVQGEVQAVQPLSGDLTGAGLLGAAVLGSLLLERRRRRGRADLDEGEADAEVALRVGADLDRARWLDEALRSLSGACRASGTPLPAVYSARVSDDRIELLVAGEQNGENAGMVGWTAVGDGRRWELARETPLPAERGHAPYPGLVCLGRDDEGRDVLVDVESADGIVAVDGQPHLTRQVVSALAVQLATVPWGDDRRVLGHDLGHDLGAIGQHGVESVDDLAAAVAELESGGSRAPATQVLSGRLGRTPGQQPRWLVAGSGLDDALAERLVGGSGSRGLGVLVAGAPRAARWRATVDDQGRLRLPLLGVDVQAVRLGDDAAEVLRDLFEEARTREPVAGDGRPPVPPTTGGDDAAWRTAKARVCVLGPLVVMASGEMDRARLPLAQEIVTFLALQPEPVHPNVVGASIWPLGVTNDVRDATIARVRDWLGTDVEDHYLLRQDEDGRLSLSEAVGVDWHAFCSLVRRSRDAVPKEEAELLRRALQLVRGPLLDGVPSRRYSWVVRTNLEQQSSDVVVDAALRLAEMSGDDPGGANAGLEVGLRLAPDAQELWRARLRAEAAHEGGAGLPALAERMIGVLGGAGVPLAAETGALLDELLPAFGDRPA